MARRDGIAARGPADAVIQFLTSGRTGTASTTNPRDLLYPTGIGRPDDAIPGRGA
jgi:hypothetical protein